MADFGDMRSEVPVNCHLINPLVAEPTGVNHERILESPFVCL